MISFIAIGRNEGWKLRKCLQSIVDFTAKHSYQLFEIIYVDSKSSDNSIEIAKSFKSIKVFQITGEANAAIARNIGANEAKGDRLFFIDGDMELDEEFLEKYLFNDSYRYFTGQVYDILYDDNWNKIGEKFHYRKISKPTYINSTGGIFIISRTLWNVVGGMKTKFKTGEDVDLSLRLAKKGMKVLRFPDIICKHHTIPHFDENRMWQNLLNLNLFYYKSVLWRDHFFNKYFYKSFIRSDYTMILSLITVFICFISGKFMLLTLILPFYVIRAILNSKDASKNKLSYFFSRLAFHFIKDILIVLCFFFFWPKNHLLLYKQIH